MTNEIVPTNEYGEVTTDVLVDVPPSVETSIIHNTSTTESAEEAWQSSQAKLTRFFANLTESPVAFFRNNWPLLSNLGWILLAFFGIRVLFALLDAVDDIPLVSTVLKLIGFVYAGWFVWRYLIRASDRQELARKLSRAKAELLGS